MTDTITTGKPYRRRSDNLWVVPINLGTGVDGRRRRITVARKLQRDAVAAAKEKVAELDSGVVHGREKATVQSWLDYWLEHILPHRNLRPNTLRNYRARCATIVSVLGQARLDRLTARHIREMHTALVSRGLAVSTSALTHVVLTKALDDAVRDGLIARNPAENVDKPTGDTQLRPALTAAQAKHLLATCRAAHDPMTWRFAVALLTGARQGEVLGLTWDRVDFAAGVIDLSWSLVSVGQAHGCGDTCGRTPAKCPQARPKVPRGYRHTPLGGPLVLGQTKTTSSTRLVPLPRLLLDGLREHHDSQRPNRHGLVWTTSTGRPITPSTDHRNWRKALDRAGLPIIPLHSARHTAATLLMELKVEESVRMQLLGHNSQAVHRRYAHLDTEATRAAVEAFSESLGIGA